MFYHALAGNGGITPIGDLLWHNDNQAATLTDTNVNGDYSKYSKIYVKVKYSTNNDYEVIALIEKNNILRGGVSYHDGTSKAYCRIIEFTDSKIHIYDGVEIAGNATTTNNNMCIATDIYGIV